LPPEGAFRVAGIGIAAPGETESGDGWAARADGSQSLLVGVVDGLGHGPMAAVAARAALQAFDDANEGAPAPMLQHMHAALHGTRGAAGAVARLDIATGTLLFAGAGNIAGRLLSGVEDRSLLSQHGTLGLQVRRLQDIAYPWAEHTLLVLHSDGITSRWNLAGDTGLLQSEPEVIAGWILRDHCRGRDDATVVVVKRR
jgi:hypothetical protein